MSENIFLADEQSIDSFSTSEDDNYTSIKPVFEIKTDEILGSIKPKLAADPENNTNDNDARNLQLKQQLGKAVDYQTHKLIINSPIQHNNVNQKNKESVKNLVAIDFNPSMCTKKELNEFLQSDSSYQPVLSKSKKKHRYKLLPIFKQNRKRLDSPQLMTSSPAYSGLDSNLSCKSADYYSGYSSDKSLLSVSKPKKKFKSTAMRNIKSALTFKAYSSTKKGNKLQNSYNSQSASNNDIFTESENNVDLTSNINEDKKEYSEEVAVDSTVSVVSDSFEKLTNSEFKSKLDSDLIKNSQNEVFVSSDISNQLSKLNTEAYIVSPDKKSKILKANKTGKSYTNKKSKKANKEYVKFNIQDKELLKNNLELSQQIAELLERNEQLEMSVIELNSNLTAANEKSIAIEKSLEEQNEQLIKHNLKLEADYLNLLNKQKCELTNSCDLSISLSDSLHLLNSESLINQKKLYDLDFKLKKTQLQRDEYKNKFTIVTEEFVKLHKEYEKLINNKISDRNTISKNNNKNNFSTERETYNNIVSSWKSLNFLTPSSKENKQIDIIKENPIEQNWEYSSNSIEEPIMINYKKFSLKQTKQIWDSKKNKMVLL